MCLVCFFQTTVKASADFSDEYPLLEGEASHSRSFSSCPPWLPVTHTLPLTLCFSSYFCTPHLSLSLYLSCVSPAVARCSRVVDRHHPRVIDLEYTGEVCACGCVRVDVDVCVWMCACGCVRVDVCVWMWMCACVCVCVPLSLSLSLSL